MELVSRCSSSRTLSKYLGYITTNNKREVLSAVSALGNSTPGVIPCAGPANERRRYLVTIFIFFLSSILEHSATSLKLHELSIINIQYVRKGGGGIHNIKHIGWKEGVICLSIHTQDLLLVA